MSKVFDTINIHTLIINLIQTNIPGTIIKFIANYINGHKAYTSYNNNTSRQRHFKTGVPQGGILSPTLFDIYTSDLPPPSAPFQVMAYTVDITNTSTQAQGQSRNTYNHTYIKFMPGQNKNIILNSAKTTCTLFTPDPAEYTSNQDLTINNKAITHGSSAEILTQNTRRKHLPNSEQINLPSSNHTCTKWTPQTHPSPPCPSPVTYTHTHMIHIISSTAPTYAPHCHAWILWTGPRWSNGSPGQVDG